MEKRKYPDHALSVQVMINCNAGGDCDGGDPLGVYQYAYQYGIPHETCQQYTARNPAVESCSAKQVCDTCKPPPPMKSQGLGAGNCYAISNYTRYHVSEYGEVAGIQNMKKEIYARGPISCGIDATPELDKHRGWGIYSQPGAESIDHIISVLGWGNENGVDYWIVRNSWGTFWGYYDFFRIKMWEDNLMINTQCTYGVPSYTKSS
eukprot:TRINITY_DN0_c737_g1_i7.p1 TRINITY_DN0_c737_g1~~TRINITY_DN0_c737_g1_i7.p1  ORF type:complete len:213 (+),score=38.29 TRINITY_DN0_c737_g1_i7:22-639(+)